MFRDNGRKEFEMDNKIEVKVKINAIVLCADESVSKVNWGHGYQMVKTRIEDFPCIDRIKDGHGNISTDYYLSRILEHLNEGIVTSFYCLKKEDVFYVPSPEVCVGKVYSNVDLERNPYLEEYKDNEFNYLSQIISLLQVYKSGNIGLKEIFFDFSYCLMGFFNNTFSVTIDIKDANTVKNQRYVLSDEEVVAWEQFKNIHIDTGLQIMKDIVDVFTFGLKQIDGATAFEKYTTALEMIFLGKDQQGKKEVLSKRVAVLLGQNDVEIAAIYGDMKNYYRYRSESLHEGDASNITDVELEALSEITRRSICKLFNICNIKLAINNRTTCSEIKTDLINTLKAQVEVLNCRGVF